MAVTITLADETVDALHEAVDTIDTELDGWYPSILDVLVTTLIAADPRSTHFPGQAVAS